MNKSLYQLLRDKKGKLNEYESLSHQILNSDIEELNSIFDLRQEIIIKIDAIDLMISAWLEDSLVKEEYLKCLDIKTSRNDIQPGLFEIRDCFEEIYEALLTIQSLENTIHNQFNQYQKDLQESLTQVTNVSKIKKYFDTYETEINDLSALKFNSKKI